MTLFIALDVGEARIGVAVSDARGVLASPYTTLHVSRDETQTWTTIQKLIDEIGAEGMIVGLPISLDGHIHAQGKRIQAFGEQLKEHISIPVVFWDERLSTVEAQRLLMERDQFDQEGRGRRGHTQRVRSRRKRQKGQEIDALAAAVILQDYLDSRSSKPKDEFI
jgi:putative Holliday junction resolvase